MTESYAQRINSQYFQQTDMTNNKRRFWTLLLTITFPIWIIPAVAIFWIVSFVVLLYAAAGDCLEMIEDFLAKRKKS